MNRVQFGGIRGFFQSPVGVVLLAAGAMGGYLLIRNNGIPWETVYPFLLLGGCVLMHVFMHHGHGSSHSSDKKHDGE